MFGQFVNKYAGCTWLSRSVCGGIVAAMLALPAQAADQCEDPDSLSFSIIPTEETSQELDLYQPVVDYLEERTGKSVDFYMPTSYSSVIEAMVGGWVDVAVFGPYSYVIAKEREPSIEVFATYAKKPGHLQEEGPGYKASLVVRADSGFDSIDSLEGAVLGLTDPASTSGNLLPRVVFTKEIDKPLEDFFSNVVYTGGHDLSTISVKEGRVDAAFVATHRFDNVIDRDLAKMDEFEVLWSSPVIPQDPFAYRGSLCDSLKREIRNTFLSLHEQSGTKEYLRNVDSNKFVPMSDSDYDIIRDLKKAKEEKDE